MSLTDIQAEMGVISTVAKHPEFMHSIIHIRPAYFSNTENACLFWAIQKLCDNGVKNIDAFNIENIFNSDPAVKRQMKDYDVYEFMSYMDFAARDSVEELQLLATTVASMAYKREMIQFSGKIIQACENENNTLDDVNGLIDRGLSDISDRYVFNSDSVLFGDKIEAIWEGILEKRNKDGTFGLPSFIPLFSEYFSHVAGDMVLVGGETGKGKSAFFLNETIHMLKQGVAVLYIDTELSDEIFYLRAISNLSGVPYRAIRDGKYNDIQWDKIKKANYFLKKARLIHEYIPEFNRIKVEQLVRKWKQDANISFVVYDYIKPASRNGTGAAEVSNNLGYMTDFLKNNIAGNLNLAVMAGVQINSSTGTIADSQKPLRYCSTFLLWREKTTDELASDSIKCGNFCCEFGKNRNGMSMQEGDYIDVQFDGDCMRIHQAEQHKKRSGTPFSDGS